MVTLAQNDRWLKATGKVAPERGVGYRICDWFLGFGSLSVTWRSVMNECVREREREERRGWCWNRNAAVRLPD